MHYQTYSDRIRRGRRSHGAPAADPGHAVAAAVGTGTPQMGMDMRGGHRTVPLVWQSGELDVEDLLALARTGVGMDRAVHAVVLVDMGRAQLLHDEHKREAEEEWQGDRGPVQLCGRRTSARERFDSPGVGRPCATSVKIESEEVDSATIFGQGLQVARQLRRTRV